MTRAEHPTGGYSEYQYAAARRSYGILINRTIYNAWYEVYKVSKCIDSSGDSTTYTYEGDRSGYPTACPKPSSIWDDTYVEGDIFTAYPDTQVYYHTIVTKNNRSTIYTFDKKHNMVREQTVDDKNSVNTYLKQNSIPVKTVVANNELYSFNVFRNQIQFYKQNPDTGVETILPPINVGTEIETYLEFVTAQTLGDKIYIFYYVKYTAASGTHPFTNYAVMREYDTVTNEWQDETLDFEVATIHSAGNYLFTCSSNGSGVANTDVYNASTRNWQRVSSPGLANLTYLFSDGGNAYFKSGSTIARFNPASRQITTKTISSLSSAGNLGFALNGQMYVYQYSTSPYKIYKFNFDAGTGSETNARAYSMIYKGTDGKLYCSTAGKIQQLDIAAGNTSWGDYTYNLFNTGTSAMLAGYNQMFITTRAVSTENEYSREKIRLNSQGDASRSRTEYAYNNYRQQVGTTVTVYKNSDNILNTKTLYTEATEYEPGHGAVKKTTDRLGNITQYEYVNSPHYIPTKVTQKYAGGPTVISENVLLDSNRVSDATTTYSDRTVKTTYTYSASSPGNVASETTDEIKNGVTTRVGKTEYLYNTDPGCPGEAYVTRKTLSGVRTNDENYSKNKTLNLSTN